MSHFTNLLAANGLTKHDGRALWRYGLSEEFFRILQQGIRSTPRLFNIDARDCALYYAAWWKCNYNGSTPSKQEVFRSIANGHAFDEQTFFEYAKRGATVLGLRWIKNQNTLYFRTLLLQGGLPVRHISNHQSAYTNFLSRILEMNPASIDDFAFDSSITSLLPASSRNDEVYACCLDIVRAILSDNSEYLAQFSEDAAINQISATLKIKKQALQLKRTKPRFRTAWVLELNEEKIRLYLSIPDIERSEFNRVFLQGGPDEDLAYEYKLFYENEILCKFIRNSNGDYETAWVDQNDLTWDGADHLKEFYLLNPDGRRHDCSHIISHIPQLTKPSLWSKYSDTQWILERGSHTPQHEAVVLFPDTFHLKQCNDKKNLSLYGKNLHWQSFDGDITISNGLNIFRFKNRCKKIEWFIADEKPLWMRTANLPVVRKKPKVFVYDEHGETIHSVKKRWRQKGERQWHSWEELMAKGLIELSIEAEGISEEDEIFNIGNLQIEMVSSSLQESVLAVNNTDFSFSIIESPLVAIAAIGQEKIRLTRKDNNCLPKSIHANVALGTQRRSLQFEMTSPFKGVEIINNSQEIITDGTAFKLKSLGGYRLFSNEQNLVVNLYNTKRPRIILSEAVVESALPLKHFEERIAQLYSLSDPIDGKAVIVMEVGIVRYDSFRKIKEYSVRQYDQRIELQLDETGGVVMQTQPSQPDLYAVPLDCPAETLSIYDLGKTECKYHFRNAPQFEKCIVFGSNDSGVSLQPAFVSLDGKHEPTTPADRLARIICYRDKLLSAQLQDDSWQQLLAYYDICQTNNLSFATFDILRACGFSSELAAKSFLFLVYHDESGIFEEQAYRKLEDDLGFFFHWAAAEHWQLAMDWIGCTANPELMDACIPGIKTVFANQHPTTYFNSILRYVLQGRKPVLTSGFHTNQKIGELRAALGVKVQRGIPKKSPPIPQSYQHILPVTTNNYQVELLLTSPVAVALSIAGKSDALWHEEHEYMRRNVKYSYHIRPEWYGEAVVYTLSKL